MKQTAQVVYTYLELGACLTAFLPVMAVSSMRHRGDPTQREPGRWMRRLGRTTSALTPLWKFTIEGEPPADITTRPHVVVANHESMVDPFILSWLPWDMRWVAKDALFRMPMFGPAMRWGGDIPLVRGQGESVRAMFQECEAALEAGISVMMFPEGTRASTEELMRFKDGAFSLALRAKVPVLPIAVAGTRQMWKKGTLQLRRAHACAKVLPAIDTADMTLDDVSTLRDLARDSIATALPDLRSRYG